jgi:hypothetical protein
MLEQVRETGFARLLILLTVIPEVDRHDGRAAILVHNQRQPVGQNDFCTGYQSSRPEWMRPRS